MMTQRPAIAGRVPPAARVLIDRRIAEEGCIELVPPFERPEWLYAVSNLSFTPIAFVMDGDGVLASRWQLIDEVDWSRAVAVRLETPYGAPINIEAFEHGEGYC